MGLNSAKGTAKTQFKSAAQNTKQIKKKTATQHSPNSNLAGGPTPPGWVKNSVQSKAHAQNMQKLAHKAKLRNDFTKAASGKSASQKSGMTKNFNLHARQK